MARRETVHVKVDDATIADGDPHAVIHPVWWRADIYDGPGMYEHSLREFSRSQRLIFAMLWYIAEVNNGGHHQFYSNSTGIVWRDAMEGFEAIGVPRAARIIAVSADRLGGSPQVAADSRPLPASLSDGLVAHFPLDEEAGPVTANAVHGQPPGTYVGQVWGQRPRQPAPEDYKQQVRQGHLLALGGGFQGGPQGDPSEHSNPDLKQPATAA